MSRKGQRLYTKGKTNHKEDNSEESPRIAPSGGNEKTKINAYNAHARTQYRNHGLFDWVNLFVLVLTFCAAFWAAKEAGRLAETAEHTERAQLRAFVYIDKPIFQVLNIAEPEGFGVWNMPGSLGKGVSVSLTLINSGETAAMPLKVVVDCPFIMVSPQVPTDPYSLFKWEDKKAISYAIGPKQSVTIGPCIELKPDDALNVGMRIRRQYILADVIYQDVIDPSIRHETQFAHEMIILNPSFTDFSATSRPAGQHNCADEACPKNVK
jgi:hypothetical protein